MNIIQIFSFPSMVKVSGLEGGTSIRVFPFQLISDKQDTRKKCVLYRRDISISQISINKENIICFYFKEFFQ